MLPSGLNNNKILGRKRNDCVQRLFAVVQQQGCCSNRRTNAKFNKIYNNKGVDKLKLGSTLPNLANICLHKSTNYKFYPFCESDKNLCEKIREDMTGGLSIVFIRKTVVD